MGRRPTSNRRKAAHGQSSLGFNEKDGRWHGYVTVGRKPDGKLDRRHVAAPTQAGCLVKMKALESAREAGSVPSAGPGATLGSWLAHWTSNIAAARVRPRTLESYESLIRLYLMPKLGDKLITNLQPENLEKTTAS